MKNGKDRKNKQHSKIHKNINKKQNGKNKTWIL